MKQLKYICLTVVCFLQVTTHAQKVFTEVSEEAGINHAFIIDQATFGGGAAVIDFDKDGYEDIYITGGAAEDALFRNNGDGTFTNVFSNSGFDSTIGTNTQGVSAADVNRDGYKDLLITTFNYMSEDRKSAPNLLFINQQDGTFKDETKEWGLDKFRNNSTGATFGDINLDGYPDLFIANYFSSSPIGISIYNESTITNSFVPSNDYLFLNNGGGKFIEVSEVYNMNHYAFGFQGLFSDYDNDKDLDLHIVNDFGFKKTPNRLYRNDYPKNRFKERSLNLQLNYGMNAMGITGADVNMDGWMDYFITNLSTSVLVYNRKNGDGFDDKTVSAGVAIPTIFHESYTGPPISWGANFFDFDHDMDVDLFVCNGALNPTIRLNPNLFFRNDNGKFKEVAQEMNLFDVRIGRGSVVFDYDNDGDLDLFVVNQAPRQNTDLNGTLPEARCLLFRNDASNGNWLQIELEGVKSELNGLGSKIEIVADDLILIREIEGGASHLSQNTTIAHFGLGDLENISNVTVHWLGGKSQTLTNVAANQRIVIKEEVDENNLETALNLLVTPGAFSEEVVIEYELPASGPAKIELFNAQGMLIETLMDEEQGSVGILSKRISQNLPSGVYFFRLSGAGEIITQKTVKI
ncbi:FG-GAP-like repeat-containing protein [Portibacter lacus]|nr:FG-GAP-like repeat-containing protein [Portibacter lacus]